MKETEKKERNNIVSEALLLATRLLYDKHDSQDFSGFLNSFLIDKGKSKFFIEFAQLIKNENINQDEFLDLLLEIPNNILLPMFKVLYILAKNYHKFINKYSNNVWDSRQKPIIESPRISENELLQSWNDLRNIDPNIFEKLVTLELDNIFDILFTKDDLPTLIAQAKKFRLLSKSTFRVSEHTGLIVYPSILKQFINDHDTENATDLIIKIKKSLMIIAESIESLVAAHCSPTALPSLN